MQHDNLVNHYKTNLLLKKEYNFGIEELENMLPFERLVYTDLIRYKIEQEKREEIDIRNAEKDYQNFMRRQTK